MTLRIIAGKFKGRILKIPKSSRTRPTQGMLREAIFNICQNEIEGALFLDLFAGSGAMGLEALSRGAARATFVEQNRQAIACIKENIKTLQVENQAALIPADVSLALTLLAKQKTQFDLIYIDPPYESPFDLAPVIPLILANGSLFLERRHTPNQHEKPAEAPGLILKGTRRFGSALLSIFYRKCEE